MFLSYAQRLEDYHLHLAFAGEGPGFYADIGGGHPVADNVTLALYGAGWRGLVVEPQRRLALATRQLRPRDVVEECLVGRADGEAAFHVAERLHGFSTMLATQAGRLAAAGEAVTAEVRPVRTLAALCARHGVRRLDLLKIDVEGAEADVLAGHDWRVRPRLVVIEAVAPGSMAPAWDAWEGDLLARGYAMGLFDGLNRFYVAEEEAGLRARLPAEPAPWNAVAHLWDAGRALDRTDHPDHAAARALAAAALGLLPTLPAAVADRLLASAGLPLADPERGAVLGRIAAAYDGGFVD